MTIFLMPLVAIAQSFNITLNNINYTITCRWNDAQDSGWVMDFVLADTLVPLVFNVPLITGADLMDGLEYLGIGSFIVYTDSDPLSVPTFDNLGVNSNVYYGIASA